jgi:hypothetical protein
MMLVLPAVDVNQREQVFDRSPALNAVAVAGRY